jgi:DNA (cytosine-5)-methyltransferase 1
MPEGFKFGDQGDSASYKQLGNGVAVGAIYQVLRAAAKRDEEILKVTNPKLLASISKSPMKPNSNVVSKSERKTKAS